MNFPYPCEYRNVVAVAEMSAGNESVGSMWLDTKTFPKETPIEEIVSWACKKGVGGKLIISIDEEG